MVRQQAKNCYFEFRYGFSGEFGYGGTPSLYAHRILVPCLPPVGADARRGGGQEGEVPAVRRDRADSGRPLRRASQPAPAKPAPVKAAPPKPAPSSPRAAGLPPAPPPPEPEPDPHASTGVHRVRLRLVQRVGPHARRGGGQARQVPALSAGREDSDGGKAATGKGVADLTLAEELPPMEAVSPQRGQPAAKPTAPASRPRSEA